MGLYIVMWMNWFSHQSDTLGAFAQCEFESHRHYKNPSYDLFAPIVILKQKHLNLKLRIQKEEIIFEKTLKRNYEKNIRMVKQLHRSGDTP